MREAARLRDVEVSQVGGDVRVSGSFAAALAQSGRAFQTTE